MLGDSDSFAPSPEDLIKIIQAQSEIAKRDLDLGGVMDFVAEQVQQLTGAGGAIVELAEGDEMVYRAASGMAKAQLGLRLSRQGSLSGLCVAAAEILRCDDSDTDPRVDREACRKVGLRSMVTAPLKHGDTVVGVLKLASPGVAAFSERDIQMLRLMSDLIAAAIHHSAQFDANELYHRATHDALTGLANRALFYDRLRQNLAQARRKSAKIGLLNLDMDGLKPINDRFGHRAGDAAIREAANRISSVARQTDTVARMGGDEFAVILPEIPERHIAADHARRIGEQIRLPFAFEDNDLALDASIGIAVFPDDGDDLDALIEKADQAMYHTKRARKDGR
jgi:diguanylate cyclase (GGDEF)-like protein